MKSISDNFSTYKLCHAISEFPSLCAKWSPPFSTMGKGRRGRWAFWVPSLLLSRSVTLLRLVFVTWIFLALLQPIWFIIHKENSAFRLLKLSFRLLWLQFTNDFPSGITMIILTSWGAPYVRCQDGRSDVNGLAKVKSLCWQGVELWMGTNVMAGLPPHCSAQGLVQSTSIECTARGMNDHHHLSSVMPCAASISVRAIMPDWKPSLVECSSSFRITCFS